MKANLLSLGYCGVEGIQFPVEVEVEVVEEEWYGSVLHTLPTEEILRIGGDPDMFVDNDTYLLIPSEYELLD